MGVCLSTPEAVESEKGLQAYGSLPGQKGSFVEDHVFQTRDSHSLDFTEQPESTAIEEQELRVFTVAHLQSATGNFNRRNLLGEGGFGEVFKGDLPLSRGAMTTVAIKRLNQQSIQGVKEWQAEIINLSQLHHPNIVRLIGYCANGGEKMLVYEHVALGSLDYHLFPELSADGGEPPPVMPWETRLKIAYQISEALALVHLRGFIHRDVKAANILLDENYDSKLTDFGLAREKVENQSFIQTMIMGSMGYLDPEVLTLGEFRASSDVYAFGILLLELVSGKHAGLLKKNHSEDLGMLMRQKIAQNMAASSYIDEQLKPSLTVKTKHQMKVIARIGGCCTSGRATDRPSMQEVADTIKRLYHNEPLK